MEERDGLGRPRAAISATTRKQRLRVPSHYKGFQRWMEGASQLHSEEAQMVLHHVDDTTSEA